MRKKILVVLFNISKAQEHDWFLKYMDRQLFEIEFAMINGENTHMHQLLVKENIPVHLFKYSEKMNLPGLISGLFRVMLRGRYHIVHAHLFEGTLAGMIAAFCAGIPRRIVTRHYSDFHHVYNPSAVKYDRIINFLATDIIAISENVRNILIHRENVPLKKIHLIHHGIDFSDYMPGAVSTERMDILKEKYRLNGMYPVVGAISKFIEWKGLQYTIPAFINLLGKYPEAVLLLVNAHGPYKSEVIQMLQGISEKNYRLIQFENDIPALYKLFTCFVHVPVTPSAEAFGQVYIESLASEVPSVFTLSGIAPEFIKDRENCLVVPFKDQEAIRNGICYILDNPEFAASMTRSGYNVVSELFDVKVKFMKLEKLYSAVF